MRYQNVWTEAQIRAIRQVADNVRLFELQAALRPYTPGAHLDVSVLVKGQPEMRSYSLVGAYTPGEPYRIAVKRLPVSRGGSHYMWSLEPGARLSISQPKNHFEMTHGRASYLLIAGGIGITPLYGMALELAQKGLNFQLLYAGSSRAEMPFVSELEEQLGPRLTLHVSDEGQRLDISAAVRQMQPGTQVYVCGPLRMLDAVRRVWQESGLPAGDLRYETFAASGNYAAQAFQVVIPRFQQEVTVREEQTLLDALSAAGIDVMYDCLRGECGLCTVDILACSGQVDHRDLFFSAAQKAENKKLCACVSRVVDGRLVIDTAYRG